MLPSLSELRLGASLTATAVDALASDFSRLLRSLADVDVNSGKRKVDGSRADTRIGVTATERWANERFRQTMLLVLEFRLRWPNNSLLSDDDVSSIRAAVDSALFFATQSGHIGDIYDLNPTVWAIWLVQRAHSLKAGGWTVESADAQRRLSFTELYTWLAGQHSLRERRDLKDAETGRALRRYVLPFKAMRVPPAPLNVFKFRKGAHRLSDWIVNGSGGGSIGLADGIINMELPAIVSPPPGSGQRDARATAAWARARAAAASRTRGPLQAVVGEGDDARETRRVVDAVMRASRNAESSSSDDELAEELG